MNLSYFTRYFWRVRINDGESFGEWSDIRTFRTHSDDTLLSPLLFYPKNDVYNIPVDSVVLYWIMAYGATGYELRVAQDSSFVKDYHIYNDITTFNDTIFNLDYNTTYFWNVRAKSSKLMSPWGDIYKFTTILKEPVTTNFKDDVFSWEPVKGAMYYHLNISLDSTFKDSTLIIKQDSITDTKFKYSGLKQDTTYFWRVSATNEKKFSDWSLIAKFKTPKITSVEEKFSDNISMNIYPIPVNSLSKIKILVNNTGLVNLEIIDIYGRHIKQIVKRQLSSGEYYFDLLSDEFSAGTYFCIFSCNADRTIQKFQIIK